MLTHRRGDRLDGISSRRLAGAENVSDRGDDERRICDGREVDEDRPALGGHSPRDGEREPGLPGSAGPGERHEPRVRSSQEAGHGCDLELAADEWRRLDRKLARRGLCRAGDDRSSAGSCRRICCSSVRSSAEGSRPSSSRAARAVAVGGERIRLATRTVEGEHLVGAKALAMRMGRNESLELGGERVVASGDEVGGDAGLERAESGFLEPRSLRLGKRLGGDVGERRPAPERECLARLPGGNEVLEALDVALALLDAEHVARCAGHDPVGAERVAKRVDMHLERVRALAGGASPPDPVDQPVGRDRLVGMEQQEREQRPRSSATERDFGPVVTPDFQGAKLPELHALRLPRPLSGAF